MEFWASERVASFIAGDLEYLDTYGKIIVINIRRT